MITKTLQSIYDELSRCALEVGEYEGEIGDAVFEITSVDTFVAGIAATILEGSRPDTSHLAILNKKFLSGREWLLDNGQRIDLSAWPEVYSHAQLIERLKKECLRCVAN